MTNSFKKLLAELSNEASKAPFSKVSSLSHDSESHIEFRNGDEHTSITVWDENDIEIESNKSGVGHRVLLSVSDVQFLLRQRI